MKKNEIYTVECIDDTNLGSGVARIENQVVFIPRAMKGEKLDTRIVKVDKRYAFGKIEKLIEPSQHRVESACEVERLCGGCQLQYMDYPAQLDLKHRHVSRLFKNVNENIEVEFPIGMEEPFYYRNKAQFPVQVKDGQVLMGFYRQHSNDIIPCKECKIQSKEINEIYQYIQEKIRVSQAKGLRHIFIRTSNTEAQVVFIGKFENNFKPLINGLTAKFPQITSIVFNKNLRKDNVILGDQEKVLFGRNYLIQECLGNKVELHFKSFYQVNSSQMEKLYKTAIESARLSRDMTCVELYSGVGTIGMTVSKYVKKVIGVEIVKEAVANAKRNCKLNNITNCEYICEDASIFAKKAKEKGLKIDVLFVDPPRKGMTDQGIQDIVCLNPKQVIYVSCNPDTLARDLKVFEKEGYTCSVVKPVDMFPQTTGLECVAVLKKD